MARRKQDLIPTITQRFNCYFVKYFVRFLAFVEARFVKKASVVSGTLSRKFDNRSWRALGVYWDTGNLSDSNKINVLEISILRLWQIYFQCKKQKFSNKNWFRNKNSSKKNCQKSKFFFSLLLGFPVYQTGVIEKEVVKFNSSFQKSSWRNGAD